jgi:hypothetical protein
VARPGSRRAAFPGLGRMLFAPDVPLAHAYRASGLVAEVSARLQSRSRRAAAGGPERLECVFYDATSYFFAVGQDDPAEPGGHGPPRGRAARR